jgi:glycosyltransferase involved in cell wall biosynthesis
MNILFLESFFAGSHRVFAEGLRDASRHRITLETLPGRFWKWRLRAGALHFFHSLGDRLYEYDLIVAGSLINLADLKALAGPRCPPLAVYFHENQLSYPLPGENGPDYQFGFAAVSNCLAAEGVLFNSEFHRSAFLEALPAFIGKIPDYPPNWVLPKIAEKSAVLYPGCEIEPFLSGTHSPAALPPGPPAVLWNHRWEFDKNPELFFSVLDELDDEGLPFRLILLGECARAVPKPFIRARERYRDRVLAYGFVESREEYRKWLLAADIAVSTADQENFGISMVEAAAAGCIPLLPGRLSYPEIIPEEFHPRVLYRDRGELKKMLGEALRDPREISQSLGGLPASMGRFGWARSGPQYDRYFQDLIEERPSREA